MVEVTETESTIKAHGLRIIHELMQTNTQLIANHDVWKNPRKREKLEQVALLLKGALQGEKMVGIKMNVPHAKLEAIIQLLPSLNAPTVASLYQSDWFSVEKLLKNVVSLLPSLNAPTVAPLYQSNWFSVESVVSVEVVRDLIPKLLKNGAEGIIEYPLSKVL